MKICHLGRHSGISDKGMLIQVLIAILKFDHLYTFKMCKL